MVGLGQIALNSAPVFGGALLAIAAGQFKAPDYREAIKKDMDLLERLPPAAGKRRDELRRTIDARIDDLIESVDRSRAMRRAALTYRGNWRDVVLFLCVLMFTVIWWDVKHSRSSWLPMFILLIVLAVVTAAYTVRGALRAGSSLVHRPRATDRQDRLPGADAE
ncbi:hypothetical protein [Mycobacterium sp. 852002-51057_SCH5723018]|uniref:hypothetical protein n=1 Tax=Mycobacterium sp. 852002-51057_SCH5723018 TaxID=1834094 RepID=UPI0007FC555B|nr:hypothetical protein [Mycobacterium sp. 852002-51057_SCH5723018]OBG23595.1 hypothetical protein A5764_10760 [Mycobacterium sp. 852002-51057_SCH5723018]